MTGKQKLGWAVITVLVLVWCLFPVLHGPFGEDLSLIHI